MKLLILCELCILIYLSVYSNLLRFVLNVAEADLPGTFLRDYCCISLRSFYNKYVFIVEAAQGNTAVIPQKRSWKIRFCNIQDKPQEVTVNGQVYKDAEFAEDKKLHGTIVILKDVPADAQVKVTFAADAAVYQRDYAEEVYEILEKAQITYAQKTEVYKVVKELGTEAVPVLVSMNLNPSLLGVLMEILTMGI